MTRLQFVDFLARAVANGTLSEADAIRLLTLFDAGLLDEDALPLPLGEVVRPVTEEDNAAAWLLLLGLSFIGAPSRSSTQKRRSANQLQDLFAGEAAGFARMLSSSRQVGQWQAQMRDLIQRHYVWQAQLGLGRRLTPSELAEVNRLLVRGEPTVPGQLEALAMYGEENAIRQMVGTARSAAYHANRSILYSGDALGLFYQMAEGEMAGEGGWVVDYISVDDPSTCSPCLDAEENGPYLPGQGPLPGRACRGRGRCRCRRDLRYAVEEYQTLVGAQVA